MRKFSKILSAFLAVIMLLGCCAFTVSAEDEPLTADTKWYNTETQQSKQAILTTPAELLGLSTLVTTDEATDLFAGWTIKLGNDIVYNTGDAAMWDTAEPTNTWTPIASFKGTFDGQGHVISGLYFNNATANGVGLFAVVDGATIKNVSVVNSYFAGKQQIGAILGICTGAPCTISNCYTDAVISNIVPNTPIANLHLGGIVGTDNCGSTIENCWFDGTINTLYQNRATAECMRIGGILGRSYDTKGDGCTIKNCLVTGSITGHDCVGGIVGYVFDTNKTEIENCLVLPREFKVTRVTSGNVAAYGLFAYVRKNLSLNNVYGKAGWRANLDDNDFPEDKLSELVWLRDDSASVSGENYELKDLDKMKGEAARDNLNGFDFNNTWMTVEGGTPVLKELAYVAKYQSSAPVYVGYQATENNNGEYKTRFIAVVDDYNLYDEIGFDITIGDKTVTFNCWNVYDSITADYGLNNYSASELGGKHIVALVLTGMSEDVDVTVTPWVKYKNADTVANGESASFTVTPPQLELKKN